MQVIHCKEQESWKMKSELIKVETVKDWMTHDVITITADTTLPTAHKLMSNYNIRRLPVVDKNGRLCGIVTRGDIRGAEPSEATTLSIWELNYLLAKLKIKKVMIKEPLIVVHQQDSIVTAARLMLENKVSGLPVLDENQKLIGIITESDIFRMVVGHTWQHIE